MTLSSRLIWLLQRLRFSTQAPLKSDRKPYTAECFFKRKGCN
ncbi:hypothetical protein C5167_012961 [Papaver somniferum]|uniref:Uncharacterized protein n=1 Tax=Papaver somniferum TaxID=3469 RepID=A0A4Y7J2Y1_PAPSO|nr:hypothetical protein C5167_012961 [Papaver somniferum]